MRERAQSGAGAGPSGRRARGRENAGDTQNVGDAGEVDAGLEDAGPCPDRYVWGTVISAFRVRLFGLLLNADGQRAVSYCQHAIKICSFLPSCGSPESPLPLF